MLIDTNLHDKKMITDARYNFVYINIFLEDLNSYWLI